VLDLTKPLSRGRRLKLRDRSIWITFKYEKIPRFCFNCGVIQHGSRGCVSPGGVRRLGEGRESQFGRWLRAGSTGNWFGGGRGGRSNGAWRHFNQMPNQNDSDQSERGEEQGRRSEETWEDDGGDSAAVSETPVGTKGATSALRARLRSPNIASGNQGVQGNLLRKGDITEKTGEQYPERKKSAQTVISGEDLSKNNGQNIYKDSSSLSRSVIPGGERRGSKDRDTLFMAEGENNSPKSRNVYVGQWDSIKEKMVWAFMEGDGNLLSAEGAVQESHHVEQQKHELAASANEKQIYVEAKGTLHGLEKYTPSPLDPAQASWKRCYRSPARSDSNEGDSVQPGKRKKAETVAELNKEGGKKNKIAPEESKKKNGKKAAAAKQPRQSQ
jgi:hypothetical protein